MNREPQKPEDYLRSLREGLNDLGQKMNKMVDDVFSGEMAGGEVRVLADEFETSDMYIISMELPGVSKDQVSLQVVDGVLNVQGKKIRSSEFVQPRLHKRERRFGEFSRSFPLPGFVDLDNIKAKFDEGILTISFPKKQTQTEASTDINIE